MTSPISVSTVYGGRYHTDHSLRLHSVCGFTVQTLSSQLCDLCQWFGLLSALRLADRPAWGSHRKLGGSHSPPCTILRHFIPLPPLFPSHTLPYVHHSYDHQWPLLIGQFQMTVTRPRRGPHLIKGKSTRRFDCRKGWMGG